MSHVLSSMAVKTATTMHELWLIAYNRSEHGGLNELNHTPTEKYE